MTVDSMTLDQQRQVLKRQWGWRRIGTVAGMFLGAVLLFAAWAKMIHPTAFVEQITTEGLDFLFSATTVAFVALALEIGIGLALVLGLRRNWILIPATLLVVFFVFLTGRAYWKFEQGLLDESEVCGCFGNLVARTPAQAFWQDLLLLVPPLVLAFFGRMKSPRRVPGIRLAVVAAAVVGGLLFAWKAPDLPLDDLATRLKPGVATAELCAGAPDDPEYLCLDGIVWELDEGEHLVVLADIEDPSMEEVVPVLNEYAESLPEVPVWVVSASTPEAHRAFYWQWAPSFEVREAPKPMLAPLYRTLPRSFRVVDGRVVETFSGLPPELAADEA